MPTTPRGWSSPAQNGYEGALREFNEAYAISPQFAVLYNIGQAHIALGHTAEAIEALTRYLRDGGDRIAPERRAQVERQIAWLRSEPCRTPTLPSEAEAARATAAAAGAAAGEAIEPASEGSRAASRAPGNADRPLPRPEAAAHRSTASRLDLGGLEPGPARAGRRAPPRSVRSPGRRSAEREPRRSPRGGDALVICENLFPAAAPPAIVAGQPIDGAPVFSAVTGNAETPTIHATTVAYLLGGLGVALGGTAIGVYVWNRGQYQDAQAEYEPAHRGHQRPDLLTISPSSTTQTSTPCSATTLFTDRARASTSVGLLAGGAYLYLYERRRDARETSEAGDTSRSWASVIAGRRLLEWCLVTIMRVASCPDTRARSPVARPVGRPASAFPTVDVRPA